MRPALCGLVVLVALTASAASGNAGTSRTSHFQSPSGNINCLMGSAWATCLVKRHTWRNLPRRPASCDVDWFPAQTSLGGTRVSVGSCRGDVGPACVPGAGLRCRTLAYGKAITIGAVTCRSAVNGVTCRRRDGRRVGFRIAREGYSIFR